MDKAPVFIGGAGRSGTTLVADMLGLHPDISSVYETDFVFELLGLLSAPAKPDEHTLQRITTVMDVWTRPLPLRPHSKREHEKFFHGPHHILFERPFAMARTSKLVENLRADHSVADE